MMERSDDRSWADRANCVSVNAEQLFSTSAVQREMRDVCRTCSVRLFCLADAMQANMRYGLWGGLTERERRQLQRMVPAQDDWYDAITTSDDPVFVALRDGRSLSSLRRLKVSGQ